jgi:hypothetical protein
VIISGATGQMAPFVNGIFDPTKKKGLDGRVLYAKREKTHTYDETPTVWIEHQMDMWCVKPASARGKDQNWANVAGGCGLEACTSRVWNLWDDTLKTYNCAADMKLVAEAEVRRCCARYCTSSQLTPAHAHFFDSLYRRGLHNG